MNATRQGLATEQDVDAERDEAWNRAAAHGRTCSDCGAWAGGESPEPDFGWPGGNCEIGHGRYLDYHAADDAVRDAWDTIEGRGR